MNDTTKKAIENLVNLKHFMKHYCICSHYAFQIKKCGEVECTICKPVKMDPDIFSTIHYLPYPIPGEDDHYKGFEEVYGKNPSEKYRPSMQQRKRRSLTFSPSQQHVKNVGLLVQCEECDKWRLIFSKHKLKPEELSRL